MTRISSQEPSSTRNQASSRSTWPACLCVCAATALLVFVVPFAIPVQFQPTVSASYVAGFSNRTAILSAAAISVAVLFWSWRRSLKHTSKSIAPQGPHARLGPVFVATGNLATCAVFGVAEWFIAHSHLRYIADAGYFIEQMSSHAEYGRSLYTQLEFAYGPLLFYPTILLHQVLRCSWLAAYFLTLMFDQSLGLVLLAYVLNELPIRGADRRIGFLLLAVGSINPLLGLNYTLFRFITPFAVLLFATRTGSVWLMTLLLAAGEILPLGISPELGFAFVWLPSSTQVFESGRNGPRWLLLTTAPALGAAVFLLFVGRGGGRRA